MCQLENGGPPVTPLFIGGISAKSGAKLHGHTQIRGYYPVDI